MIPRQVSWWIGSRGNIRVQSKGQHRILLCYLRKVRESFPSKKRNPSAGVLTKRVMARYGQAHRCYSSTPSSDDYWSKKSYAPDHVCRPIIIDAEGRRRPVIFYGSDQNADHCVAQTGTISQHVHSPLESEYKHSPRWTETPYGSEDKLRRSMASVNSGPQNVDEFFTEEQADASRSKVAPKSTGYEGYDYGDYFRKQGGDKEPAMITGGGWARPSHSTWAAPGDATTEVAKPSATTSSRYIKLAYTARLHGTRPSGREDSYTSAIDSRVAARKHDGSGVNPIPE